MKVIIIVRDELLIRTNSPNTKFVSANDAILQRLDMYYKSPIIDFNKENGLDNEFEKFIKTCSEKFAHFHCKSYDIIPVLG